jgi:DNA repair protein RecN (Recombination protein N)
MSRRSQIGWWRSSIFQSPGGEVLPVDVVERGRMTAMLESLSISALGVIEDAELEFGPGFTVVTGETGAGKTMVVTALGLLLGSRADTGAVRRDASQARVEGHLSVDAAGTVARRAEEAGAALDDGTLIVARTVSSEGRSRAYAGGASVPAAVLTSLGEDLVAIHGQADQVLLLQPTRQRECLDAFGGRGLLDRLELYRETYREARAARALLDELVGSRRERTQEADLLRFGLAEIDAVAPVPGEDRDAVAEELRLSHVDGLQRAADAARLALSGDESGTDAVDALTLVAQARRALDDERDHDPQLAALSDQVATASYALADAAADIASYASGLDVDPLRLAAVQERRAVLGGLLRKYGDTLDDVLAWRESAGARLIALDDDGSRIDELSARVAEFEDRLIAHGQALSLARQQAAADLGARVTAELVALAIPHARFAVTLDALAAPSGDGLDEVAFVFSAHDGAELRPLQRGASGGELSRLMLAIEVCRAGTQPVPTMIFDEVDAGVGGKAAVEIGRRLARLARNAQVIAVTHLPQVAAFADRHYAVVKASDGRITTSGITVLDDAGRRRELSRMLAGLEDSDTALAHADELVALAVEERRR